MAKKNKRNWEEITARKGKKFNTSKGIEEKKNKRKLAKDKTTKTKAESKAKPQKQDDEIRQDILIGRNPVLEALKSGREIEKIIVATGATGSINRIISQAREKGIVVHYVNKVALDRECNGRPHQGIIAQISPYKYAQMSDIFQKANEKGEEPFIVVLDKLEDPHNLGAIMRTAECAGAHGIIIPKRHSCGLTEVVAKASAGAIEYVPCVRVNNISQTLDELKKEKFWIAACDMGDKTYYEQNLTGKLAVVIGSEGFGVSKLVKEKCDFVVSIPMVGKINSLNASNAAAVLMYEVRKQRDLNKD